MTAPYSADDDRKKKELAELREKYLRVYLTPEARYRLNNLKLVGNETANLLENKILELAINGKLDHQINDEELKDLLSKMQANKREFKIVW
ncbi:MAG: DNA-binding protein [Conexivisphaerales archaeon]